MALHSDDTHYVPILKGKQGELDAIRESPAPVGEAFTPLIEVPPIPPKYVEGEDDPIPAKSIASHVADVAAKLADSLGTAWPFFIDGFYIEEDDKLEDGSEPVAALFSALRHAKLKFIPAIGLDRVADYAESVKAAIEVDGRGCCLRLLESDLESLAELKPQVESLLAFLGVGATEADLLVDFGPKVPSRAALPYQVNALPLLEQWRSFTVASSCFPENMEGVAQNSIFEFERLEWVTWAFLRAKRQTLVRMPAFGDYAINHPELSEIDPRIMRMSPNIRYTAPSTFVVAKGEAYPRKKDARKKIGAEASVQYPRLAKMVMNHPSWQGEKFSWGDAFIEACSRKACVGSPTNWRAVGTSHHIAFVVRQLASLP